MTNRICAFTVILEENIREDEINSTVNAIEQIKNVLSVKPITSDINNTIAYERVKNDIMGKIYSIFYEKPIK